MTSDPLGLSGQLLHGQFRVDDVVADAAESVLYRGHHLMLDVPIALKMLKAPRDAAHAESLIRRFRHESRLHYKLAQGNPDIVRVLASGTAVSPATSALCPFMVREWLAGRTLADDLVARRADRKTGRDLASLVRLFTPAVEALIYAHSCGVLHREITPGRLFVTGSSTGERLKVLDFGRAKVVTSSAALDLPPDSQSTVLRLAHEPAYAAPEQLQEGLGAATAATDVYSLAIVLLEVLRDRPVFEEPPGVIPLRVLDRARRPTPRSLGMGLPAGIDALLTAAVQVEPSARPGDLAAFWRALTQHMSDAATTLPAGAHLVEGMNEPSPLAHSVAMDSSPPASNEGQERTVVMEPPSDLLRSIEEGDQEPVTGDEQLFVSVVPPTDPTPPPAMSAAHGRGARARTMVSPGQEERAAAMRALKTIPEGPQLAVPENATPTTVEAPGLLKDAVQPPPAAPIPAPRTVTAPMREAPPRAAAVPVAPPPALQASAPPAPLAPRVAAGATSRGPSVALLGALVVVLVILLAIATFVLIRVM